MNLSALTRVVAGSNPKDVLTASRINLIQDALKYLLAGKNLRSGRGMSIRPSAGGPSLSRSLTPDPQLDGAEQTFIFTPYSRGFTDDGDEIRRPSDLIKNPNWIDGLGQFSEEEEDEAAKLGQAYEDIEQRDPLNLISLLKDFTIYGPRLAAISPEKDFIEFLMPGQYEITIETESEIIPEGADDALIMKWPVLGGANQSIPWYPTNPKSDNNCTDTNENNGVTPWYNKNGCNGYIVEDAVIFESPSGAGSGSPDVVWEFYPTTYVVEEREVGGEIEKITHPAVKFLKSSIILDYAGAKGLGAGIPNYHPIGYEEKLTDDWWYLPFKYEEFPVNENSDSRTYYICLTLKYLSYDPMAAYSAEVGIYEEDDIPKFKLSGSDMNVTILEHTVKIGEVTQNAKKEVEGEDNTTKLVASTPTSNSFFAGSPITLWPAAIEGLATSHPTP